MAGFDPYSDPYEQGGITGGRAKPNGQKLLEQLATPPAGGTAGPGPVTVPPLAPGADEPPPVPAAPAGPPALGSNRLTGFDMNKFADPNRSEKYKIGDVFSRYDPRGGVTKAMLDELNALGIAEFSGEGDQLTVNNTKNDPRFGRGGTSDVIKGLKGNNADTAWQPWFVDEGGGSAGAPAGGGGIVPRGTLAMQQSANAIDPMLSGDPMAAIQAALAQFSGGRNNIQALLSQLQG